MQREPSKASFRSGTLVRIAGRHVLRFFEAIWTKHNAITVDHLRYAGHVANVERVCFYPGGDAMYGLYGLPGLWHEPLLSYIADGTPGPTPREINLGVAGDCPYLDTAPLRTAFHALREDLKGTPHSFRQLGQMVAEINLLAGFARLGRRAECSALAKAWIKQLQTLAIRHPHTRREIEACAQLVRRSVEPFGKGDGRVIRRAS